MPKQRLPFPGDVNKDLLEVIPKIGGVEIFDGYVDQANAIHKRPGLFLHQQLEWDVVEGIDGIYWWESKTKLVVVAGGKIYAADGTTNPFQLVSKYGDVLVLGACSFATNGYWLYISSRDRMIIWDGKEEARLVSDPVAPISVSHVGYLNGRILANQLQTNRFWYTEPPDPQNLSAEPVWEGHVDVERAGESIQSLIVSGDRILIAKERSIEYWFDDGVTPFKREEGAFWGIGISAPKSLAVIDNLPYWLTFDRQFVRIEGTAPRILSQPYDSLIRGLGKVEDAVTFSVDRFVVLTFPSEKQTLVFDMAKNSWYQWGKWETELGEYQAYLGQCATFLIAANLWILGGRPAFKTNVTKTFIFDYNATTDDGETIRFTFKSPFLDYGTHWRKQSNELILTISTESIRRAIGVGKLREGETIPDLPNAKKCEPYSFTFPEIEGFTWDVQGLPNNLVFDKTTRTISKTGFCDVGEYLVTILLTDERGATYRVQKKLIVEDIPLEIYLA